MRSTFRQRNLVVYLFNWNKHSLLIAQLTERMCLNIAVTDAFPRTSVSFPCSRVTTVLLVTLVFFPLVFLTEPSFRQLRTTGMVARVLCFPWHHCTSSFSGIRKALTVFFHHEGLCLYASLSFLLIIQYHKADHCKPLQTIATFYFFKLIASSGSSIFAIALLCQRCTVTVSADSSSPIFGHDIL